MDQLQQMVPEPLGSTASIQMVQMKERVGGWSGIWLGAKCLLASSERLVVEVYQEGPDNKVSDLDLWVAMRKREPEM